MFSLIINISSTLVALKQYYTYKNTEKNCHDRMRKKKKNCMTRKAYLKVTIICKNALYYGMNEEICLYGDVKEYKS